jgi:prepilin-type N-terminal cleavage/methylation domain-containing protein
MKLNQSITYPFNKKGFSLFEIIIVIVLLSIIYYTLIKLTTFLSYTNKHEYTKTFSKLELENIYFYLQNKLQNDTNLSLLKYKETYLLYNDILLLKNVYSFELKIYNNNYVYNICLENTNIVCEEYTLQENK